MNDHDGIRPEAFYIFFDEFAKRNLSYRIPIRSRHTYLDALAVYLNVFAEELEQCIALHQNVYSQKFIPEASHHPGHKLSAYIHANLQEPLPTLRELARMYNTNERQLQETFQKLFSISIYRYYTRERLRKAERMILETEEPLRDIAYECGFNTYHNFSTAFRKQFGYTPSMLRKRS